MWWTYLSIGVQECKWPGLTEEDLLIHRLPGGLWGRRADSRSFLYDHLYPTTHREPVDRDSDHQSHLICWLTSPIWSEYLIISALEWRIHDSLLRLHFHPIRPSGISRISTIQLLHYQTLSPIISSLTIYKSRWAHLVSKIRSSIARISFPLFPLFSSANSSRPW